MVTLPPRMPPAFDDASEFAGEVVHSVHVESDFQDLHAHMNACATRRSWSSSLQSWAEELRALMLRRIVASVTCAAVFGLMAGSVFALIFPA